MPFPVIFPSNCRAIALEILRIDEDRQSQMSDAFKDEVFHWYFGSSPLVVATIWYDLRQANLIHDREHCFNGFRRFLVAQFYLWVYPRSAGFTSILFQICKRHCYGKDLWHWIGKIAALVDRKIKWDDSLGDPEKSDFVCSIDCTDVRVWEARAHHHLNIDRRLYSKKHNHAGYKYEIVLNLTQAKCMSIVGPHVASHHDMELFREKTKAKLLSMPGKMGITDSIYKPGRRPEHQNETGLCEIPRSTDDNDLKAFKSRARARHESFNARLKNFAFLQYTYRGTKLEQHGTAFRAIAVIVQYQMDNGSPIFALD